MTQRRSQLRSLVTGLLGTLAAASRAFSATGIAAEATRERSSPTLASPQPCPHPLTWIHEGEIDRVLAPTPAPTPTPTPTYRITQAVSEDPEPCPVVTGLVYSLDLRDLDLESLLGTVNSLSVALVIASASALPFCQEANASLAELRASTASLAISASSKLSAVDASASEALSAVEVSAASALSVARKSAAISISQALATATSQEQVEDTRMAGEISTTIAAIAIAVSAVGSSLLSLLACYLFMRRCKAKQRKHQEETEVNAALDRAIVSYIVKELPSPTDPSTQEQLQPLEHTMTNAIRPQMDTVQADGPIRQPRPQPQPVTPADDPREFIRRTQSAHTDTPRAPNRRTASSHFTDSLQHVYADILARPLERARPFPGSAEITPAARRDDVGWPLAKNDWV